MLPLHADRKIREPSHQDAPFLRSSLICEILRVKSAPSLNHGPARRSGAQVPGEIQFRNATEVFWDIVSVDKHRTVIIQHSRATANQRPADSRPTHRRSILAPTLDQSRDVPKSSQSHCPRNTAWNERSCSIFWYPELKNTQKWDERFQGFEGYNQHKKCTWTCSSLQQFCFHCLPVFSTRLGLFRGNTMENSGK